MRKRKWTQKTEHDFRFLVCRSAIGQFGLSPRTVVTVVMLSLLNLPTAFDAGLIGNAFLLAPLVTVAVLFVQQHRLRSGHYTVKFRK